MNNDKPHQPPAEFTSEAALLRKLDLARSQYAAEWSDGNARKFSTDGHYQWMAGFLRGYPRTLEIGTGDGSGTAALLSAGHTVISVDENPACLSIAERKLKASGYEFSYEKRELVESASEGYKINYMVPRSAFPARGALLLDGDILNDPGLLRWFAGNGQFDAITCWLMGTYFERTYNATVATLGVTDPGSYRFMVHRKIQNIAENILAENGLLHVVDRCVTNTADPDDTPGCTAWRERCANYYGGQLGDLRLKLVSIDHTGYQEPTADISAAIKLTRPPSGQDPEHAEKTFVSVLFRKT